MIEWNTTRTLTVDVPNQGLLEHSKSECIEVVVRIALWMKEYVIKELFCVRDTSNFLKFKKPHQYNRTVRRETRDVSDGTVHYWTENACPGNFSFKSKRGWVMVWGRYVHTTSLTWCSFKVVWIARGTCLFFRTPYYRSRMLHTEGRAVFSRTILYHTPQNTPPTFLWKRTSLS